MPRDEAGQLLEEGFARTVLTRSDAEALTALHREAAGFFSLPEGAKRAHGSADFNFGFRPFGRQYSITPDRPDLNESFTYWGDAPAMIPEAARIGTFVAALHDYWGVVARVADAALRGLARALSADGSIAFAGASYIEINAYFRTDERELLQDRHEDGHLLTVITSDGPGLEIERPEEMEPVDFAETELGIMPGSLLTDLTGGRIAPLYHQVRNHGLPSRQSILFLVNPPLDRPMPPWIMTEANRGVDVAERARTNGQSFGLPEAPVLSDSPSP